MRYSSPVRKFGMRYYSRKGIWEMSSECRIKKGHEWKIPLSIRSQKNFFLKKHIMKSDRDFIRKGGSITVSFGDCQGTKGCLITNEDL